MARPEKVIRSGSVAEVIEQFMDWTKANRPKSYEWYKKRIDHFYKLIADLSIDALRPLHIQKKLDKHAWSPAFKAGCVTAVKRCFNWALEQGYIDKNPLRGLKKPDAGHREMVISQEEFDEALSHVRNPSFKDMARFQWFTGCRPEEAVRVTAAMYEPGLSRIVIPIVSAKGKKRPRVIYLCDQAKAIVERNLKNAPTLFLNTKGRPWQCGTVASTWGRIEKKTGKRFCAYGLRHSYATHQLQNGTDCVTLATLLGHADTAMLSRVYANLSQDPAYLRKQAARRNGGS
jgi:integrase